MEMKTLKRKDNILVTFSCMPITMSHYNTIAHMSDNNICSSWWRNLTSIEGCGYGA